MTSNINSEHHSLYDKHQVEQLLNCPQEILHWYTMSYPEGPYVYFSNDRFKEIPIPKVCLEMNNLEEPPCFEIYAEGFVEGCKHNFIALINTPDAQIELVMNEILKGFCHSIPLSHYDDVFKSEYYKDEEVFDFGFLVGKQYKAWFIVLTHPKIFENEFLKGVNTNEQTGKEGLGLLLNDKGTAVLEQLVKLYAGARPLSLFLMLKALEKLNLLRPEALSNTADTEICDAIARSFNVANVASLRSAYNQHKNNQAHEEKINKEAVKLRGKLLFE